MPLQFIIGSSGAGKSRYIYDKIIRESLKDSAGQYLVIVPEQFTMQTQKELVTMHPGKGILNIDVLSFARLAYRISEEVGGDDRQVLEETGKTLVLQKVIQQNKENLGYLASQMKKPGAIQEMKSLISELMQYDIQKDEMEEMTTAASGQAILSGKMKDVKLLYEEFRRYLQDKFITGEETMDVLCRKIRDSEKIRGCTVVFDGFTGFTPIQYKILREMMQLCPQIYVAVTLGDEVPVFSKWKPYDLFAMSKQMIDTVTKTAGEAGIEVEEPVRIAGDHPSRFSQSPALAHLEKNLFRYHHKPCEKENQEIALFCAANPLEEMTKIARKIVRLVRREGYRYGEIAVVTGDLETYGNYAKQAFETADIPYFLDRTHSVLMNPFVEFIRSALHVMAENFSYESVFRHLRCGMTEISQEEADRLENYVLALGIRGRKRWEEPWERTYRGMEAEELPVLNEIRERAMAGLFAFADEFKQRGNTVLDDTKALYNYISRENIQERLRLQKQEFAGRQNLALEKEYEQIYGIVIHLFDQLTEILGDEKVTQKEYVQLMEAGLSEAGIGIIPLTSDEVLVGDIERTRLKDIKALFFVGVNEGVIPKAGKSGGILSDSDREFFKEQGISLAPTPREAMYMQRFYLYLNMTKPSHRLCLSYSQATASGEAQGAAYLITVLCQLFPRLQTEESLLAEDSFESPKDSFSYLAEGMGRAAAEPVEERWLELYSWFFAQPAYREFLRKLADAAFLQKPKDQISESVAKVLYGEVSPHSATRLEKYAACAFAHFLRYGLSLTERQAYEFTPMDLGNVMHSALELFAAMLREKNLDWRYLTEEERMAFVDSAISQVTEHYGNTILHSSARNQYMIERMRRILNRTVWALQMQLAKGEFLPEGFEVSIGGGRLDRLDTYETENQVCVKIIDYKTGNTSFDLLAVYHGLQLQLMVYLDGALGIEKKKHPDKEVVPAGIFYYNLQDPMIREKAQADLADMEQKILKELSMNGLATNNLEILEKMDPTLLSLPVSLNKNGSFSRYSKVAGKEQFLRLSEYVQGKIGQFRREIEQGIVEIAPYELGKKSGCDYCPYGSVCGFDQKIPGFSYRRLRQFSDEEIWKSMIQKSEETGKGGED